MTRDSRACHQRRHTAQWGVAYTARMLEGCPARGHGCKGVTLGNPNHGERVVAALCAGRCSIGLCTVTGCASRAWLDSLTSYAPRLLSVDRSVDMKLALREGEAPASG